MTRFKQIQKQIIKNYILKEPDLFQQIVRPEDYDRLHRETWTDSTLSEEYKYFLLQSYTLTDEVLLRVYIYKRLQGRVIDFFTNVIEPNVISYLSREEEILVNSYLSDEFENVNNSRGYAEVTAQMLGLDNELWKLFESQSDEIFIINDVI